MAAIYHAEIPVDLAGASRERPLPVQFFRGDNDSHIFTAWVGDSANPEAGLLAGTVAGTALRGDGVTVTLSGEKGSATVPVTFNGITVQATPCRVTLPQAAFRIPGMIKVSIVLTDGETTTTVLSLSGSVVQTNTDAVTDPEELIPNLSALQTAAAQAIAAAEDAETAAESVPALVAPTFNTTTAYAAGDYVYYNGSIWRFTTAHAAGAWTGSDAVQTTVTDEYSDLKSQINFYDGGIETVEPTLNVTTGKYVEKNNGTLNTSSDWFYCDYVDISNAIGHKITITDLIYKQDADTVAFCAWYTSDKTFIGSLHYSNFSEYGVTGKWTVQTVEIQLPSNAAFVRMSGTAHYGSMTTDDLALSFEAYDKSGDVYTEIAKKSNSNQGIANAGKYMGINNSGEVVPMELPGIADGSITYNKLDSSLKETIDTVVEELGGTENVDAELDITTGSYVYQVNGGLTPSTGAFYCDYVDISHAVDHKITITDLIYNQDYDTLAFCAWYTADKTFIGSLHYSNFSEYGVTGKWTVQTVEIQLPSNAAFVRMSGTAHYGSMTTDDLALSYVYRSDSEVYEKISEKLDINQGAQNTGKFLGVNNNGDTVPTELPVSNLLPTETTKTGMIVAFDSPEGNTVNVTTEATAVYRTGKNIFMFSSSASGYTNFGVFTLDADNQVIYLTMQSSGSGFCKRDFYIPVKVGDKITVSTECVNGYGNPAEPLLKAHSGLNSTNALNYGVTGGVYQSGKSSFVGEQGKPETFTITSEDVKYVQIGFALLAGFGWNVDDIVGIRVQAEYGETATAWEPYQGLQKYPSSGAVSFTTLNGVNTLYATRNYALNVTYPVDHVVSSVNGKAGKTVLTAEDIGALPNGWNGYDDIVRRNQDMIPHIFAASRYGYTSNSGWNINKQFTLLVTTDTHGDATSHQRAIDFMDAIQPIDAGICMGDIQSVSYGDNDGTWFTNPILAAKKKFYPVIGNHDCGMSAVVGVAATKQQQFDKFFAPLLQKLEMTSLETTYYTIDPSEDLKIIVLDTFDNSDELLDENTYKVTHGSNDMSQDQLDWLCDTLLNTPSDTHVLIITHYVNEVMTTVESPWTNTEFQRTWNDPWQWPGLLSELVNAWQTGTSLSKTYNPTYDSSKGSRTIDVDFTSRGTGIFAGFLCGHTHRDYVLKMTNYNTQNVIFLATNSMSKGQNGNNDMPRVYGTRTEDLVTVVTVDTVDRKIKMVRIGSQISFAMQKRDIIAIDY